MLNFLFARLTPRRDDGTRAFAAVIAIARRPAFFRHGQVPDTIDGRFALLTTVLALLLNRIELEGDRGNPLSVVLTERFIAAMEAEHRELGLGDPTLGKTVRKLVGALARRVDWWRSAIADGGEWSAATRSSVYASEPDPAALELVATELRALWSRLVAADLAALANGAIG